MTGSDKDLAGDFSRLGTRNAEASPKEIGLDAFAIRNRRISRQLDKRRIQ
jgi:hypothetical protein